MKFDQAYKQDDFLQFLDTFLPLDFVAKEEDMVINEKRCKEVKKANILGVCESLDLHVLELEHDKESDPRITIASDAFKILADHWIHKALVIFKSKNSSNYRLSLLSISLEPGEKNKINKKYSNAKRYSFYLGPNASVNTPNQFLISRGRVASIEDLASRFSVDVVTKEFFDTYKDTFLDITDEFNKNETFKREVVGKHDIKTADFVKKLMGQIVFLYFLQRKGWLGVQPGEKWGTGDPHFVRNIFELCKRGKENFFNDYLEPLFYDCLGRADRGNRNATNDQSFAPQFNSRIPYLNEGLFVDVYDWKNTNIEVANKIIEELLSFFDQYNFTIDENTPSDQEVSVDPEMLGKIFENLLAIKDRKSMGAYYTPREIVHYMCRESLVNYLLSRSEVPEERIRRLFDAKDAELFILADEDVVAKSKILDDLNGIAEKVDVLLRDIKVVDPAVGSGAFPMGMLSEISSTRYYLNNNFLHKLNEKKQSLSLYDIKRETLENCIYGVDLDPGAVEIAKLRFWLALVVDHNIDEIEALPNLDYKIMQGNSLLEDLVIGESVIPLRFDVLPSVDLRTKDARDRVLGANQAKLFVEASDSVLEDIRVMHAQYFKESSADKKGKLKKLIDTKEQELIVTKCQEEIGRLESVIKNSVDEDKKKTAEKQVAEIKITLDTIFKDRAKPYFLWHLNFAEIFSEKGGFDVVIGNPPYISMKKFPNDELSRKYKEALLRSYRTFSGKSDIYCCFFELALDGGAIPPLLREGGTLSYICSSTFFCESSFQELRDLLFQNKLQYYSEPRAKIFENANVSATVISVQRVDDPRVLNILGWNSSKKCFEIVNTINQAELKSFAMLLIDGSSLNLSILAKAGVWKKDQTFDSLADIATLANGISSAENAVWLCDEKTTNINDWLQENKNVFKGEKNIIKYYKGNSVSRYHIGETSMVINYLRSKIIERNRRTHSAKDPSYFSPTKILSRLIDESICMALDDGGRYVDININMLYVKDLRYDPKFILAVLNSRLIGNYIFNQIRSNLSITQSALFRLSIKMTPREMQEQFVDNVDKILENTRSDNYLEDMHRTSLVKKYEQQIDQMVYKLYGLTPEEIEIVENSTKK